MTVAVILLCWVRVCIDNWILVKHLAVRLVLCQALEVGDLVFDLRFDFGEFLWHTLVRQAVPRAVTVVEASVVLVRWHDMLAVFHGAHLASRVIVRALVRHLTESWIVRAVLAHLMRLLATFLPDTSGYMPLLLLVNLAGIVLFISLLKSFLARKSRLLTAGTVATGTRWTEIHDDGDWLFVSYLIAPSLLFLMLVVVFMMVRVIDLVRC